MKLQPAAKENILKVSLGNLIMVAVLNLIFYLLGYWDTTVLLGSLFGWLITVLNFVLLCISIQKAMDKEQKQAQVYMQSTYTGRMAILAVAIFIAMTVPFFNWIAMVISLIFTRISITLLNLKKKEG